MDITPSIVYDYIKIAKLVLDNLKVLNIEKAPSPGYKKLKLLTQKLAKTEKKTREGVLRHIEVQDSYPKMDSKIRTIETKRSGVFRLQIIDIKVCSIVLDITPFRTSK